MITLDGSYGEGGGQILRNAAVYAVLLGQDLSIAKIRAGRSTPGLRRQHMTGLALLADCCGGHVEGLHVGSQEILFRMPQNHPSTTLPPHPTTAPRTVVRGDTQTAGSICLLLQAALPVALMMDVSGSRSRSHPSQESSIQWILRGGTNATNAPQYDYWQLVFLPMLRQLYQIPPECIRPTLVCRGFFPKGGGEVHVDTRPLCRRSTLPAIHLTKRGDVVHVLIRSIYSGKCPRRVAEAMAQAAKDYLDQHLVPISTTDATVTTPTSIKIQTEINYEEPAVASGSGIILVATTDQHCRFGGSAVGSPRKAPGEVGIEAATELCATLREGGCVDDYLQDQLILYMALAEGTSEVTTGSLTQHTRTAIWTAEQCCGVSFQVIPLHPESSSPPPPPSSSMTHTTESTAYGQSGRIPGRHRIRCTGIGMPAGAGIS